MHVYDAVTTKAGRYVQGGGCTTVGVAGLVQSGGFGSFSKNYGTAAASLLEAEVVTADGAVRIANACTNPDLLWALKGGGGGSFGVVTRLTLETRNELAERAGAAIFTVKAMSGPAFRGLIRKFVAFYADGCLIRIGAEGSLSNATKRCRSGWCRTVWTRRRRRRCGSRFSIGLPPRRRITG